MRPVSAKPLGHPKPLGRAQRGTSNQVIGDQTGVRRRAGTMRQVGISSHSAGTVAPHHGQVTAIPPPLSSHLTASRTSVLG